MARQRRAGTSHPIQDLGEAITLPSTIHRHSPRQGDNNNRWGARRLTTPPLQFIANLHKQQRLTQGIALSKKSGKRAASTQGASRTTRVSLAKNTSFWETTLWRRKSVRPSWWKEAWNCSGNLVASGGQLTVGGEDRRLENAREGGRPHVKKIRGRRHI